MLLAPLDLPHRARHGWDAATVLWNVVARGMVDHLEHDTWRGYVVEVRGTSVVPPGPTEPVHTKTLARHGVTRSLVVTHGSLTLDGAPLAVGGRVWLAPGMQLGGAGRGVVVEQYEPCDPPPGAQLVQLRAEYKVKGVNVLVLSGRLALAQRMAGTTVIPPDHIALSCKGELRPGNEIPWLVLIGEGV